MDGDKVRKTAQAGCLRQTLMVRSAEVVSSVLSIMTEGLRLAGKEGFDGKQGGGCLFHKMPRSGKLYLFGSGIFPSCLFSSISAIAESEQGMRPVA